MSDSLGVGIGNSADPITVLFVDDDRQWAQLMAEDIEAEADNIDVTIAGSATEFLETFRDHDDIDCILADYQMPGKDGLQLLKQIRKDNPRLPFLLVTSQGSEAIAARATDAGVTDYLIKEFSVDQALQFVNKIETAVDHYRLQRAIEESEERYRTVTEQSRDGIGIFRDEQLLFANERLIELTGRERDILQDRDIVDEIVHREDRDQVRAVIGRWFEGTEQPLLHETRIVQPDGTIRHCESTGGRINYGGESAVLVSIRDVTDRKQRERALQWERELNRTIQQVLVESRSRESLEQQVTSQLQRHGYALAWIAEETNEQLEARCVGGDRRYVDAINWSLTDSAVASEPSVWAAQTGEAQFHQNFSELSATEWRETATEFRYRSGAGIPLVHNEIPYGVLTVYADRPDQFDETERRLLSELADTVAFAIHSLETQDALAADKTVVVSVQVETNYYLVDLAAQGAFQNCERADVVGTIPIDDQAVIQYIETDGCTVETLRDLVASHDAVRETTVISETAPERLQVTVTEPVPEATFASQGVIVQSTTLGETAATVDIELPATEDVRSVVEPLEETFGAPSVLSVQEQNHTPVGSRRTLGTATLTEKQLAALRAAYYKGYFSQPRESSATEVAESLEVSHSTFLRHLRAAQDKIFGAEFD